MLYISGEKIFCKMVHLNIRKSGIKFKLLNKSINIKKVLKSIKSKETSVFLISCID